MLVQLGLLGAGCSGLSRIDEAPCPGGQGRFLTCRSEPPQIRARSGITPVCTSMNSRLIIPVTLTSPIDPFRHQPPLYPFRRLKSISQPLMARLLIVCQKTSQGIPYHRKREHLADHMLKVLVPQARPALESILHGPLEMDSSRSGFLRGIGQNATS
jgi:hypothetical protein